MLVTPFLAIAVWMIAARFDGSVLRFARALADPGTIVAAIPRPTVHAAGVVALWVAVQGVLLYALPGPIHLGPVTPTGQRPRYRLNGVSAWFVTHAGLAAAWRLGLWSPAAVIAELGSVLVVLNLFALGFCLFLYWKGRLYPSTSDAVYTGHLLFDLFQGIELQPAILGVNLKQLINCRVSMMGWSVLVCCCAGAQVEAVGFLSTSMAVSAGLLVAYLFKFFVWESGYFASLDIMHDRFGYYICWGVLVWVPSVYTVSAQVLVAHPIELGAPAAAAITLLGLGALWMNYAADAQRQRVRATGGATTIWGRPPRLIRARYQTSDGEERENLLLVSGYWGIARHFHYLPELAVALSWALPAGGAALLPYTYVIFLGILLVDRAGRDDLRCRRKYGAAWAEYCRLVPYRMVPGLY
jgi:7-dehydrocholesterol reductase